MRTSFPSTLLLAALTACAGPRPTQSGFLPDYGRLHDDPRGGDAQVWASDRDVLGAFDAVCIEPVEFWIEPGSRGGVRPADLTRLSDLVHEELVAAVAGTWSVVDQAGPRVVRLRVAVTHLVPGRPLLNTATQVPPARAASTAKKLLLGTHLGVGQVGVEAQFEDSVSGAPVLLFADVHVGRKFEVLDGLTTWGHVEDGLHGWAAGLRAHLQAVRERRDAGRSNAPPPRDAREGEANPGRVSRGAPGRASSFQEHLVRDDLDEALRGELRPPHSQFKRARKSSRPLRTCDCTVVGRRPRRAATSGTVSSSR